MSSCRQHDISYGMLRQNPSDLLEESLMRYCRVVALCLCVAVLVNGVDAQEKAQPKKDETTKILKDSREHLVKSDAAIAADKPKESDKENEQFWTLLTSVADKFPTVMP